MIFINSIVVTVVQVLSHIQLFATPWTAACQAPLSSAISPSLLEFMSIELVMFSKLSSSAVSFSFVLHPFPGSESFPMSQALHIMQPKYWSFSFSICPSNEYSGLISFRIDWFKLLAVQGAVKSLLHHHNSKIPIIWHSAFFVGLPAG